MKSEVVRMAQVSVKMNKLEQIYGFMNVPYLPPHLPTHLPESILGCGWRTTAGRLAPRRMPRDHWCTDVVMRPQTVCT